MAPEQALAAAKTHMHVTAHDAVNSLKYTNPITHKTGLGELTVSTDTAYLGVSSIADPVGHGRTVVYQIYFKAGNKRGMPGLDNTTDTDKAAVSTAAIAKYGKPTQRPDKNMLRWCQHVTKYGSCSFTNGTINPTLALLDTTIRLENGFVAVRLRHWKQKQSTIKTAF